MFLPFIPFHLLRVPVGSHITCVCFQTYKPIQMYQHTLHLSLFPLKISIFEALSISAYKELLHHVLDPCYVLLYGFTLISISVTVRFFPTLGCNKWCWIGNLVHIHTCKLDKSPEMSVSGIPGPKA